MRGIDDLKDKLNNDRFTAVSVESVDGFEKPYTNFTKADIIKNFGSVETFFDDLAKDYPNYKIIERRQNGTVIKGDRTKVNYKTISVISSEVKTQLPVYPSLPQGLNTPNFGLGMADIISLNIDKVEKARLELENNFLKKQNEELIKIRDEYREFKLSNEYSDKKGEQTNSLVTTFLNSEIAGKLVDGLAGFMAKSPTGLNAPVHSQPEPQEQFVTDYKRLPENAKNLFKNIMHLVKHKEGFFDTLADLIEMDTQTQT